MQLGCLLTKNLNLTQVLNMEDLDQHLESQKDLEEDSDDSDHSSRKGQNSSLPLVKHLFESEKWAQRSNIYLFTQQNIFLK